MRSFRHRSAAIACGLVTFLTLGAGATGAQADEDTTVVIDGIRTNAPVANTQELDEFIESDTPKIVNVSDGRITSVLLDTSPQGSLESTGSIAGLAGTLATSTRSPCASTDACLHRSSPYSQVGFYGTGTAVGSWPSVIQIRTKSWSVRYGTGSPTCVWGGPIYGPNSTINTGGATVCRMELYITA